MGLLDWFRGRRSGLDNFSDYDLQAHFEKMSSAELRRVLETSVRPDRSVIAIRKILASREPRGSVSIRRSGGGPTMDERLAELRRGAAEESESGREEQTTPGLRVLDYRSVEYKALEAAIASGARLSQDLEDRVDELVAIHVRDGFMYEKGGEWFKHEKARAIGEALHDLGGISVMRSVALRVIHECGDRERPGYPPGTGTYARCALGTCWNRVGDWAD